MLKAAAAVRAEKLECHSLDDAMRLLEQRPPGWDAVVLEWILGAYGGRQLFIVSQLSLFDRISRIRFAPPAEPEVTA